MGELDGAGVAQLVWRETPTYTGLLRAVAELGVGGATRRSGPRRRLIVPG
jgi:hypothetical protein